MLYALIDYIICGAKLLTKIVDIRVSKIPQGTMEPWTVRVPSESGC